MGDFTREEEELSDSWESLELSDDLLRIRLEGMKNTRSFADLEVSDYPILPP